MLEAQTKKLAARKQWMVDHLQLPGAVVVDDGAAKKIAQEGKSLLPIGMTEVKGEFFRGDVIAIVDGKGLEIARGLANYASSEARLICKKTTQAMAGALGYEAESEMIHRDNMVMTIG